MGRIFLGLMVVVFSLYFLFSRGSSDVSNKHSSNLVVVKTEKSSGIDSKKSKDSKVTILKERNKNDTNIQKITFNNKQFEKIYKKEVQIYKKIKTDRKLAKNSYYIEQKIASLRNDYHNRLQKYLKLQKKHFEYSKEYQIKRIQQQKRLADMRRDYQKRMRLLQQRMQLEMKAKARALARQKIKG